MDGNISYYPIIEILGIRKCYFIAYLLSEDNFFFEMFLENILFHFKLVLHGYNTNLLQENQIILNDFEGLVEESISYNDNNLIVSYNTIQY